MRLELKDRPRSIGFLAVSIALASAYLYWALGHYRAARHAEDLSQESLETAVRLEPRNAEFRDLLGRFYLYAGQEPAKASAEFEAAIRENKHSSRYWLDVASADGLLGDTTGQRNALEAALKVDPRTPMVAWEAGNFFLVDGKTEQALDSFKTVLAYDPVSMRPALDLCWRATQDVPMILAHAMPKKVEPHLELMRILTAQQKTQEAMLVWRAVTKLDEPFKVAEVMPFVEYLVQQRHIDDAQELWTSMAKLSPSLRTSPPAGNMIVNGDFDEEILPGGFSWRITPPASQSIRIDTREIHGGTSSVSFTFAGPAFADYGFSQFVPVKGKQAYELKFAAKSEEILSTDGPRIMVEDVFGHSLLAQGNEWQGTHGWDEQSVIFYTKPETRLVRIFLGRADNPGLIRGTLWLDNVQMFER